MMEEIDQDPKNMKEELPVEALRIEKEDINDIKILKYIHSLKQRKIHRTNTRTSHHSSP